MVMKMELLPSIISKKCLEIQAKWKITKNENWISIRSAFRSTNYYLCEPPIDTKGRIGYKSPGLLISFLRTGINRAGRVSSPWS